MISGKSYIIIDQVFISCGVFLILLMFLFTLINISFVFDKKKLLVENFIGLYIITLENALMGPKRGFFHGPKFVYNDTLCF